MREFRLHGSVRGALSNERPYREQRPNRIWKTSLAAAAQSIEKGSGRWQLLFVIRCGRSVPTISHCHKGNLDLLNG